MGETSSSRPFLSARWRNLILLSYEVDPACLIDLVPAGTTLDSWRGKVFVSLVGFQFLDTKILGAPVPFHQDFEEVNLRFYVRHAADDGVRLGVVFIRELVPRPAVGGMARLLYREPYRVVPMRSKVQPGPPPEVEYQWDTTGRWCTIRGSGSGDGSEPAAGSLEEFLTVRHWGYNGEAGKETLEYRVDHARWRVWHAQRSHVDYQAAPLCAPDLARALTNPASILLADGSAVSIRWRNQLA